jgi:hypothetical protein
MRVAALGGPGSSYEPGLFMYPFSSTQAEAANLPAARRTAGLQFTAGTAIMAVWESVQRGFGLFSLSRGSRPDEEVLP